jgi:hypothetical protein
MWVIKRTGIVVLDSRRTGKENAGYVFVTGGDQIGLYQ